jgi:hypothetical protein
MKRLHRCPDRREVAKCTSVNAGFAEKFRSQRFALHVVKELPLERSSVEKPNVAFNFSTSRP